MTWPTCVKLGQARLGRATTIADLINLRYNCRRGNDHGIWAIPHLLQTMQGEPLIFSSFSLKAAVATATSLSCWSVAVFYDSHCAWWVQQKKPFLVNQSTIINESYHFSCIPFLRPSSSKFPSQLWFRCTQMNKSQYGLENDKSTWSHFIKQ